MLAASCLLVTATSTTYHGRVALEETKQYDHAAARNSHENNAHNVNTYMKTHVQTDGAAVKVLSSAAVAYDFKDNTVADVDCMTSDWGDWNHCTVACGGGVEHRSKQVLTETEGNGQPCGTTLEFRDCNTQPCAVSCDYEWSEYSECSQSCGGGYKKRTPKVSKAAAYGGKKCPEEEEEACGDYPCPLDCDVSEYGEWGECDKSCGEGIQYRTREILKSPEYGGKECPYEYKEERNCKEVECAIHCKFTWGDWGECSYSCGGGHRYRAPDIEVADQYGGEKCPDPEEEVCNTYDCPVDCMMSDWAGWGDCSEYCGEGVMHNRRIIKQTPDYGGRECPAATKTKVCYEKPCPKHCEYTWGEWNECDYTCGGGSQYRDPVVSKQPQYGGDPCPDKESRACKEQPCPVDCVVGDWYPWSKCSEECGQGLHYKKRSIKTHPGYGGRECPKTTVVRHCNLKPCEYHDDDQFYQGNIVSHKAARDDDEIASQVGQKAAKHLEYAARAAAKTDAYGVSDYGGAALNMDGADDDYQNKREAAKMIENMTPKQIAAATTMNNKDREEVRTAQQIKRMGHSKAVENYKTGAFHVTREAQHRPGWVQGTHYGEDYLNPDQKATETRAAHLNVNYDDDYMRHRSSDDDHFEQRAAQKTVEAVKADIATGSVPDVHHAAGKFASNNHVVKTRVNGGVVKAADDDDGYALGYGVGGASTLSSGQSKTGFFGFDYPSMGSAELEGTKVQGKEYSNPAFKGYAENVGPSGDTKYGGQNLDIMTRTAATDYEQHTGIGGKSKRAQHFAKHTRTQHYDDAAARADLKAEAYALNNKLSMAPDYETMAQEPGSRQVPMISAVNNANYVEDRVDGGHKTAYDAIGAGESEAQLEHQALLKQLGYAGKGPQVGEPGPFAVPAYGSKVKASSYSATGKLSNSVAYSKLPAGLSDNDHEGKSYSLGMASTSESATPPDWKLHRSAIGRLAIGLAVGGAAIAVMALVSALLLNHNYRKWALNYMKGGNTPTSRSTPGAASVQDENEIADSAKGMLAVL